MSPKSLWSGLLFLMAAFTVAGISQQQSPPADASLPHGATEFVRQMVHHELDAEDKDHTLWRYRIHKEDDTAWA